MLVFDELGIADTPFPTLSHKAFIKALIGKKGQELYHKWRGSKWRSRRIILRDPDYFE